MEKKDVFISHHEDSAGPLAAQIANALESVGISCWYAPRDITPGKAFREEIPAAIYQCKVFLLLLNPEVENSDEVLAECELAYERHKKQRDIHIMVFPVNGCKLPHKLYIFEGLHRSEGFIPALVRDIARILHIKLQPSPTPQPPTQDPPSTNIIKRGKCGDNVTYTLDENGVLTISGNGPMGNFEWESIWHQKEEYHPGIWESLFGGMLISSYAPWWDERLAIYNVEIQGGVTSIGNGAFSGCARLKSVIIPDSVTKIGTHAFSMLYRFAVQGLTSVFIPDSVKKIGWFAFSGCQNLKSLSVHRKTKIGLGAVPDWTHVEFRW